ncbi:hypothetical protein ACFQ93_30260 [Streptomyces sp. NPDC056601]|uniref:hypothetical protein n=1 Tax=Streptomyces sp. NPDC056601 TaxID=3345875 RepID=UPI003687CF81
MRREPLRSVLLFLTDRCPVECAHCSVGSLRNSPAITDFPLFEKILDGICGLSGVELVGVSGGEPFVERRGLTLATERLRGAGKSLVLYTSGVWARTSVPDWTKKIVSQAGAVFLSTDAYHAKALPDESFVRAARAIRHEGVNLVVQVIRMPEMVEAAVRLLEEAFGSDWRSDAELSLTPPLPYGRGQDVFKGRKLTVGREFGPCPALSAPVVRYDGRATACCNERVIVGQGPQRLRSQCADAGDLSRALDRWADDSLLRGMASVGPGPLTEHPALKELGDRLFGSVCELCWAATDRMPAEDRILDSIVKITEMGVDIAASG